MFDVVDVDAFAGADEDALVIVDRRGKAYAFM